MLARPFFSTIGIAVVFVASPAAAVKVTVRGTSQIDAQCTLDGDAQMIRGTLHDDVGAAVTHAHVEITVSTTVGGANTALPPPKACSSAAGGHPPHAAPDQYVLDTDEAGVFCVRAPVFARQGVLHVRYAGGEAIDGSTADITFDAARAAATLAWDPAPDEIDLDLPNVELAATAMQGAHGLYGQPLTIVDERGKIMGSAVTDTSGRGTFSLRTADFGPAGTSEWELRGPGLPSAKTMVTRFTRATLVAAAPIDAIVPQDGYPIDVVVESTHGQIDTGTVSASIGEDIVGAAQIQHGRAKPIVTFAVKNAQTLPVTLRYLPAGPTVRAGAPLVLDVPVRGPSPLRRAPLLLAGLGLFAWIARNWRRAPATATAKRRAQGENQPIAELVAEPIAGAKEYRGLVIDAHARAPIENAEVRVLSRGFSGEQVHATTRTDARGAFLIAGPLPTVASVSIEANLHARLERPLPKPGTMTVALVARRRALLDRLVAFARRVNIGPSSQEPTPAVVAKAVEGQGLRGRAAWARAVEAAAYGPADVDRVTEERVDALVEERDDGAGRR